MNLKIISAAGQVPSAHECKRTPDEGDLVTFPNYTNSYFNATTLLQMSSNSLKETQRGHMYIYEFPCSGIVMQVEYCYR